MQNADLDFVQQSHTGEYGEDCKTTAHTHTQSAVGHAEYELCATE